MKNYKIQKFPKTRIATIDVCEIGKIKHHIPVLIEFDITESLKKINKLKEKNEKISFTSWIVKAISESIKKHQTSAAFLKNKRNLIIFDDINISIVVEKELDNEKIPIPLVIEKTNQKTIKEILSEIDEAKKIKITKDDIVLNQKTTIIEKIYYYLPGFIRRQIWRFLLNNPKIAFKKMGNVVISSVGMMGKVNGWFIQTAVHPISFGISSIIKKPAVIENKIKIRDIIKMTILIDHDVIDGSPMVRFITELTNNIENGFGI